MSSLSAITDQGISSREQLLLAASALMVERQTIDISLSDLAKKSGLNGAMVKYYFGNKHGLLLALVEYVLGQSLRQMEGLIEMDLAPVDKLKLHIRAITSIYFRYPYINRLIHLLFDDPQSGRKVAESINRPLAKTQRKLIEQGVAAGVFRNVDTMQLYFIVLGACDHLFFGQQILRTAFGIETVNEDLRKSYTETFLDILFRGILTPEALNGK